MLPFFFKEQPQPTKSLSAKQPLLQQRKKARQRKNAKASHSDYYDNVKEKLCQGNKQGSLVKKESFFSKKLLFSVSLQKDSTKTRKNGKFL